MIVWECCLLPHLVSNNCNNAVLSGVGYKFLKPVIQYIKGKFIAYIVHQ